MPRYQVTTKCKYKPGLKDYRDLPVDCDEIHTFTLNGYYRNARAAEKSGQSNYDAVRMVAVEIQVRQCVDARHR